MSSSTGLSRTRSLRQPQATSRNQLSQRDGANNTSESGSASPSRLPQIKPLTRSGTISGTTSSSTTSSTAATTARSRAASSAKSTTTTASGRPLSGIFSSRPSTTSTTTTATRQRAPTGPENAAARPLGRAPSIRQVSSQQPPAATTTTTTTTSRRVPSGSSSVGAKRPTSSGGLPSSAAPKTRAPTHTRAKSTATALTAATTLRPPVSSSATATAASPSSASTTSAVSHAGRPSTTRLHARNVSQSGAAATAPPQSPVHGSRRPTFDTNQQYYSPLKSHAPKPLTSTFLAPPSPSKLPSNVAISAETSRLQTELLQLSLLHREAGAVTRQWHESARRKLGRRFKAAAAEHESICAQERDGVEARNVAALLRWGSQDGGRLGLEEKLQALDQILDEVWALTESEGRYGRVVEGFEAWAGRMADIMAKRRSGRADDLVRGDEVLFVSDLDTRWKDECAGHVRKLEAWCLMLNEIGPAPDEPSEQGPRSSLSRILEGCTSLVVDMLAELEVMLGIERDARRSEDDWIERMSEQLKIGDHETMDREPPLWKMVI
ncbi:hypothetical protein PFICI_08130 [Pestalotiopsis fici W106-1]|uniref:Uncharacterized protein n=1 Tax=Pestalotiopsis fici (strain W106-1 / CGMCC3.15140) TaxID=1229662 RepID=W3X602_PESFW|nr:uncharacterized protein PFICI_08130 [Pestalotiopsis fici W106-1]ETS80601.1 hypothetical protein PFICI_08130 [Pestalotiopsis fici W106-1]